MPATDRLIALDALRAVAILLVLGRHVAWPMKNIILDAWQRGGWVGVDLFFVLSGFLVSGLLFREQQQGKIQWLRFYVRRGFKIYPAFWCLILFTVVYLLAYRAPILPSKLFGELFFVQNYFGHLYGHTWSLAVEEHFYLLLPPLLIVIPPRNIPRLVLMFAVALLAARCCLTQFGEMRCLTPTHLRLDSLFFGVLLSYYYHYHPSFRRLCSRHHRLLYVVGIILLVPAFLWPLKSTPFIPSASRRSTSVLAHPVGGCLPRHSH